MKMIFRNIQNPDIYGTERWHDYMIDNFTHNKVYDVFHLDDNVGTLVDSDNGERYIGSKYYEVYFEPLRDVNLNRLI